MSVRAELIYIALVVAFGPCKSASAAWNCSNSAGEIEGHVADDEASCLRPLKVHRYQNTLGNLTIGLVNVRYGVELLRGGFLTVQYDNKGDIMVAENIARSLNGAVRAIGLKLTHCGNSVNFQSDALLADPPPSLGTMHLDEGSAASLQSDARKLKNVWQISLVGGICGGKTSSLGAIKDAIDSAGAKTFAVPEVTTEILKLVPQWSIWECVDAHRELQVQAMMLQLSWQHSWALLARKQTPVGLDTVGLTDRDIFNQKIYTKPLYGWSSWSWTDLSTEFKLRLGALDLQERDLVQTYPLGAIFLQSLAIKNGSFNKDEYNDICKKDNLTRGQDAAQAMEDDEHALKLYQSTYPPSKLCIIRNDGPRAGPDGFGIKVQDAVDCAMLQIQDMGILQNGTALRHFPPVREWREGASNRIKASNQGLPLLAHMAGKRVTNVTSAHKLIVEESARIPECADGFSLAIYPGAFNPPTFAHVNIAKTIIQQIAGVDAVWLDMAHHAGDGKEYVNSIADEREAMTMLAVQGVVAGGAATRIQMNLQDPLADEYFEVLRALASGKDGMSKGALTWVIGSDVAEGMQYWQEKARRQMMLVDEMAVVLRSGQSPQEVQDLMDDLLAPTNSRTPKVSLISIPLEFAHVSSSKTRQNIVDLGQLSPPTVLEYVLANNKLLELYKNVTTL